MTNKPLRVLVIDDEEDFLTLMKAWVSYLRYEVLTTQDVNKGIEMVRSGMADIVLVDYRMPEMMGDEVVRKIREFNDTIPTIVITAFAHENIGKKTQGLNILSIISKQTDMRQNLDHMLHIAEKSIEDKKKERAEGAKDKENEVP